MPPTRTHAQHGSAPTTPITTGCGRGYQFDGATEALTPVLGTPAEHRVRPLLQRLTEVRTQAMTCEQPDDPALRGLCEAITDFRRQAVIAELIT
jgi:hypothetical protein